MLQLQARLIATIVPVGLSKFCVVGMGVEEAGFRRKLIVLDEVKLPRTLYSVQ